MSRDVRAEGHRVIRVPQHRVWQLVSRPEAHPRHVRWWLASDVLERAQSTMLVEFRGLFGGLPITSIQRMTLRQPGRVEFKQMRGTLRGLSGSLVLKDRDGDTDLVFQVAVDAGIPLLSDAAVQQILVGGIEATLTSLKATAERDLARAPRRTSAAPTAPAALSVAAGVPDDAEIDDDEAAVDADVAAGGSAEDAGGEPATSETSGIDARPAPPARDAASRRRRRRRGRRMGAMQPAPPGAMAPAAPSAAGRPFLPASGAPPESQRRDAASGRRRRGRRGRGRGRREAGHSGTPEGAPGGGAPPASPP
jgi:hypothetical protein